MSKYTTKEGDTFFLLSRRFYGSEDNVDLIRSANPGVLQPLQEGTSLIIPTIRAGTKLQSVTDPDQVRLFIGGKLFTFWTTYKLRRSIDSFSIIQFGAPFDPSSREQRDFLRPFEFQPCIVAVGDSIEFFGYMLPPVPSQSPQAITVGGSAYSRAAILSDCNFSGEDFEKYSLNDRKLNEIAELLCSTVGLSPVFVDDAGQAFKDISLEIDTNPFEFFTGLAQQRNLIISDDPDGNPVFWRSAKPGKPVAVLNGNAPEISIEPVFDTANYFSHITAVAPADTGFEGSKFTVKNTRLETVIRPHNFKAKDTDGADTKAAALAKAGRMFANAVSYKVTLLTWRDEAGDLWRENTFISLHAPGVMIYKPYIFLIKNIEFLLDSGQRSAQLMLVLPGAYSGEIPEVMPWDE